MKQDNSKVTVSEAVAKALLACGVDRFFGIPGGKFLRFLDTAKRHGLRAISTRNEASAAFMAAGYAKATGQVGVVFVQGPGAINTLTAVAAANYDHVPLLILSTQVPRDAAWRDGHQETTGSAFSIDTVDIFRSCTCFAARPPSSQSAVRAVHQAIVAAIGHRRPAAVEFYSDLLGEPADTISLPTIGSLAPSIAVERLQKLAAELTESRQPVVIVGERFIHRGGSDDLLNFCETFDVACVTTEMAKGAIPEDHPMSLGSLGRAAHGSAFEYLRSADWSVILGARLGAPTTVRYMAELFSRAVQIDNEPCELARTIPVRDVILGDVVSALRGLAARATPPSSPRATRQLVQSLRQAHQTYPDAVPEDDEIKLAPLFKRLRDAVPRDTLLVTDVGTNAAAVKALFPVYAADGHYALYGLAAMGSGLPLAHGVQLARPKATVVSVIGDGGFLVYGTELHTAAEYGIPVIHIVIKNNGFGCVTDGSRLFYGHEFAMRFGDGNYAMMCESLGGDGYSPENYEEFSAAVATALERRRLSVIEITSSSETIFDFYHKRVEEVYRKL